jgi:2-haloacid dehalogenase
MAARKVRPSMLKLDPEPQVITFDCYGTLVQWHHAVREAARVILSGHAQTGDVESKAVTLADRLRELAVAEQQRPPFRNYKAVLHSSLDEALAESGYVATTNDQETLLSILRRIEPHPEVPTALDRLRGRYRLAVISNTDDDLIAGTVAAIGTPIEGRASESYGLLS